MKRHPGSEDSAHSSARLLYFEALVLFLFVGFMLLSSSFLQVLPQSCVVGHAAGRITFLVLLTCPSRPSCAFTILDVLVKDKEWTFLWVKPTCHGFVPPSILGRRADSGVLFDHLTRKACRQKPKDLGSRRNVVPDHVEPGGGIR
ncbi:hypothetical protein VMCG_02342 [Cytospora schulzeri]|uniref:Uncharacterized protein n=1 Tax=Cytospora schulzeri TaxID=448051 RepID=A0A423X2I3_9PEZI|nr:hypothetical protein VMCG_02342 [Valsa malicola]